MVGFPWLKLFQRAHAEVPLHVVEQHVATLFAPQTIRIERILDLIQLILPIRLFSVQAGYYFKPARPYFSSLCG